MFGTSFLLSGALARFATLNQLHNLKLEDEIEELKQALLEKDAEIASLKTGQLSFPFTFRT